MARPKKPTYEWVERLGLYRKRIKDVDGKYFALYAPTPDELTKKIVDAKAEIDGILLARENPTVEQYAERWLELQNGGTRDQNNALSSHILPKIGKMLLKEVMPDDIRSVLVVLSDKSESLQSKVLNTMRKMFEAAEENDLVRKNPCGKITPGGVKTKEKNPLTDEQQGILLEAVKGTRAETFVLIGLYAGLRREEILGLCWDCVTLKGSAPHISVCRALRWEKSRPIVSDKLKSKAARRDVPIPSQLVGHLKTISKDRSPEDHVVGIKPLSQTQYRNLWRIVERRQTGETTYRGEDSEKVSFVREKGAKSASGNFRYTIDFDVTPHLLRHTYITNLFLGGLDIKQVQYLAGHNDPQVTLKIYIHLMKNKPEDLIDMVKNAFEVKSEVKNDDDASNP